MNNIFKNLMNYILSIACFLCIYLCHKFLINTNESTLVIAAFGASAVLVFSNNTIKHSFFKIVLSSVIAAVIGVFLNQLDLILVFKISLAISASILIMNLIDISYPPAGAITLIPLISNPEIQSLGYLYTLYPTVTGLLIIYSFSKIKDKLNTIYYGE